MNWVAPIKDDTTLEKSNEEKKDKRESTSTIPEWGPVCSFRRS